MKTSGDRASWLNAVAKAIMDGGNNPPSTASLYLTIPLEIVTARNDGHVTAAIAFGESRRKDCEAGQQYIIGEMLEVLRDQNFIGGDDNGWKWLKPLDGEWHVKVDSREYSVFGQRERRVSKDRNMLGETSAEGITSGPTGMFASGKAQPYEVEVIGRRGGREKKSFQVHPLALAIPPMTERERESLRASILRDGVKVPLVIFQGKVLDGRHRFYFASTLKRPVQIEEFTGTEEEAKRLVATLNLHRRHLTVTQQTLASVQLLGEEARKETAAAQRKAALKGNQNRSRLGTPLSPTGDRNDDARFENIVARKAQELGLTQVTPRSVKALKGIEKAPKTKARIESGELGRIRDASKAIQVERDEARSPPPLTTQQLDERDQQEAAYRPAYERSILVRLGECLNHFRAILHDDQMPTGTLPKEISERAEEIERIWPDVRRVLRRLGY